MSEMVESLKSDLKKFEDDVEALNKKLEDVQAQKERLVVVGRRLEGAISYIRQKIAELQANEKAPDQQAPKS